MPRAPLKPKPAPLMPQTTTLILKMTKITKATTNLRAVEALHPGKRSLIHFDFASSHFSPVTPSLTLAAAAAAAAAATATARRMRNRRPPAKPSDRRNSDFLFLCASRKSLEISLQFYFPAIVVLKQVIRNIIWDLRARLFLLPFSSSFSCLARCSFLIRFRFEATL